MRKTRSAPEELRQRRNVAGNRVEMAIHNIFSGGRSTYPGLENPAGLPMAESITENFIKQLQIGDLFVLGGRIVRLIDTGVQEAYVERADGQLPTVPRWNAAKMPLLGMRVKDTSPAPPRDNRTAGRGRTTAPVRPRRIRCRA